MFARRFPKFVKVCLIGLAAVALAAAWIHQWVIPAVLIGRIEALTGAKVEIASWWIDRQSAGVVGLRLSESQSPKGRALARASKVSTDLSLGSILQGQFSPRRVTLHEPECVLHIDEEGRLLSTLGVASSGNDAPIAIPTLIIQGGTVTFHQEGRPEMVVRQVTARLDPERGGLGIAARTSDPRWGPLQAFGHFSSDFGTGKLDLKSVGSVETDPERVRSIPFVPKEVWENVLPDGPVKIAATIERLDDEKHSIHVETRIELLGTSVRSPSLDLEVKRSTGLVTIRDGLVSLDKLKGLAIGGTVGGEGTLDFEASPPKVDLNLALNGVEVADAPARWQLGEAGVVGRLTGGVHLVGFLKPAGIDLTGSSGEGTVENGTIQGIPFKSIKLAMKASGDDLQYETPKTDASKPKASRDARFPALAVGLHSLLVNTFQAPAIPKQEPPAPVPTVTKPKSITTQLELEDVDLAKVISRAQVLLRSNVPIPISGRFSMKAEATIPLGKLAEIKAYAFHGDLKLTNASIAGVDIGKIDARLDLADGLLELTNFRGILADNPKGEVDHPPSLPAKDVPVKGPLPAGGFRGNLRAELSPLGRLKANFEGIDLPLGELTAPLLPSPTPLSGLSSMKVNGGVNLDALMDPDAWELDGTAESRSIRYESATLDDGKARFTLKQGTFLFEDVKASMQGKPFKGRARLEIKAPQRFETTLDLTDWNLESILKWVPSLSPTIPLRGLLSGSAHAEGTLSPLMLTTDGSAKLKSFVADTIPLGDLAFVWKTVEKAVQVEMVDHQSSGGGFRLNGVVPLSGADPIKGSLQLTSFDAKRMAGLLPKQSLDLSGRFDGEGTFVIPRQSSAIDLNLQVSSTEMVVRKLPAEQVRVHLLADKGTLRYKINAESLGGTWNLNGEIPILDQPSPNDHQPNGVFQTVNFQVEPLWKAIGQTGLLASLQGRGAIDANLRASMAGKPHFLARGIAEFRDLRWGTKKPVAVGLLKSVVELSTESWRLDPLSGTIFGGQVSGSAWGTFPDSSPGSNHFDVKIDRAALDQFQHLAPASWPSINGHATVRLVGSSDETLRAHLDVLVPQASIGGMRVKELKLPVALVSDASGSSTVVHARQWTAKLAGGSIRGDSSFRTGESHAFRSDVQLSDLDLEAIVRTLTETRNPASGKLSGKVSILGPHPDQAKSYRGHFNIDLSDASLVALPIFREIDKFLGSARGGLFEEGNLNGEIANGQLNVNSLSLAGRVAQLHASGTVGMDGQLDLEVLVNTNQIIPRTGKALAGLIPGLGNLSSRGGAATAQFAGFLSSRLLKLRVTGNLRAPSVTIDPSVSVGDSAVTFFGDVFKLP